MKDRAGVRAPTESSGRRPYLQPPGRSGLIARAAFPQSQELDQLTENIYHFKSPKIAAPPKSEDQSLLVKWKEEAVGQLQVLVEREYGAPLETLLRLLSQNMYARAK